MTKLAVLISDYKINVQSATQADLSTYESYLHSLEEWSSSLPQSLQHFPDSTNATKQSAISIEDEIASVSGVIQINVSYLCY
jgi:hypothetical protein